MNRPVPSLVSLTVALALSLQAYASESASSDQEVEKVSVLGQRLEYNTSATGLMLSVKDTPQSISIIDADLMRDFALQNVADIVGLVPGITVQAAETSRFFFTARGNAVTNFQYDGVPVFYSSFFSEAVSDSVLFERVEVVRGATGLLSGAGEPSAAINLIRKKAQYEQSGYLSLQAGRWNSLRIEGDFNTPLTQDGKLRARVAASKEKSDSYVNLAEEDNQQLYFTLAADVGDSTTVEVGLEHAKRRPKGSTWGALPLFYADGSSAADLDVSSTTAANWSKWDRDNKSGFVNLTHHFNNGWLVKGEYERRDDSMDGHLLYASGYPDKQTGLGMQASTMIYQSDRVLDSARLYASGPFNLFAREHRLIIGTNLTDQEVKSDSFYAADSLEIGNFLTWDGSVAKPNFSDTAIVGENNERQLGAYIATQLSLSDEFTAVLGNRFSRYEFENEVDVSKDYKQSGINTPYAGLIYAPTDAVSLYASYTEIFTPQNYSDKDNRKLEPIEGNSMELGIKSTWLDDRLLVNAAVFKGEKDNVAELDSTVTEPLPDGSFAYVGVKGTEHTGFEVELSGEINDVLTANLSYTQTKSEKAKGEAFATHVPKRLVRMNGRYEASEALHFAANINWQSDMFKDQVGPGNAYKSEQASYWLVNLMASYALSAQLNAQLNISNLFDKKYYSSIDFYNQGFFGTPRNIEVSLRYQF
ncbi:TonB-dependent siderophore receptor [Bowmanella yangjiangensis]|uniref:TonB-dependent siderophore receptor n=1 Tax=Bowmanella yangjiangensis TaxID=2811230 RepID=A0ABS3CYD2_9ALTE|nr:TonB-dependent siderophore receptor [Bowmanella yangjiangensis]MBN7821116.1 TonB-dependent siderophore receptor [Bowmanella yangjiangensis]